MATTPTLSDIAEAVGVSVMTVSRALADRPGVSSETRQRVLDMAKRMGYNVDAGTGGRTSARTSTNTIGVLVNNIGSEYIGEIIDGISGILEVASYDLVIFNPKRMRLTPENYIYEVSQRAVDGLLVAAANIIHNVDYIEQLVQLKFPIVFVDQQMTKPQVPYVTATNWQGAFDATRYLIQLGHRHIGFIAGGMNESPSAERLRGYNDALAQSNIPANPELVREGDFSRFSGYQSAQSLVKHNPALTAIFASNDPMAFGAMEALGQAGKCVPGDVSVVGFDDIPSSAHSSPPLTTVRQPLHEMGRVGAEILLDMLRGNPTLPKAELRTSLILRESCIPLR